MYGVAVRPGDLIVGDDGMGVVPKQVAAKVIEWVEEHEHVEEYAKALVQKESVGPGRYYPSTDETVRRYRDSLSGRQLGALMKRPAFGRDSRCLI